MRKKVRKKTPLPEIQEEGLLTPLRRGQSVYVQSSSMEIRRFTDLEYGPQSESSLTSHVEMAAALVDQVVYHSLNIVPAQAHVCRCLRILFEECDF